jgi:hypothetical protein
MPVWGWVLIVGSMLAIVICGGGFVLLTYLGNQLGKGIVQGIDGLGPAIAATSFYTSMETGDYETAHALLGPQLARQYSTQDLRSKWQALENQVGAVTMVPPDFEGQNNSDGSITVTLTSSFGGTYRITLRTDESNDNPWTITSASPWLIPEP